ncbi:unnamed protein product [Medioppia subpectinata]|uniref:Uncharacterized protein n=1 Tax=Medioppia subpectinata TaxID=1979941 RepID=A0A7R9QB09_9ACAR|nr:unnamed protein product [Medioppia subpectinata]CAG2117784.1 unnamed protein product [Medioppia subpectinata]
MEYSYIRDIQKQRRNTTKQY